MRLSSHTAAAQTTPRVLDPTDRIAEVLFGLIMVLTFTGSLSVAQAGRDDVRAMLIGALGCNLAWGVIDAVLYLMACLGEQGHNLSVYRAVHSSDIRTGRRLVADALPPVVASVLEPADLDRMRERIMGLPAPPARARLRAEDWRGAVAVFLLVFLSTLPVVVPFLFVAGATRALRISNVIAVAMLCATGVAYGRHAGRSPWLVGVSMVLLGAGLVAMTIALGG